MKNLKFIKSKYQVFGWVVLLIVFSIGCKDSEPIPCATPDCVDPPEVTTKNLDNVLDELEMESGIIIVHYGASIQEAINVAEPGNVIYIEAGTYDESLLVTKPNLTLVGLSNAEGESVTIKNPEGETRCINTVYEKYSIEMFNIQLQNFPESCKALASKNNSSNTDARIGRKSVINFTRESLGNGIAHYEFDLQLGRGEFDVVRVHRVVRESQPHRPVRTNGNVFMIHGSIQDFEDIFLYAGATSINPNTSAPLYLALNDIDVWGIDLGWTRVPLAPDDSYDFSFMENWGVERDAEHIRAAMLFARLVRGISSYNFSKMNLLGFSYGATVAYTAAGKETQKHQLFRNIKGLIPVDMALKFAPDQESFRQAYCQKAQKGKENLANGKYANNDGANFAFLSNLATTDPDGDSPVAPMTNYQAMVFYGNTTYATGSQQSEFWHFVGGKGEELFYTDVDRWFKLTASLSPYQPVRQFLDVNQCLCDEADVSIDDYLDRIKVPILYLGAAGGTGEMGQYTVNLTASTDVSNYIVSVNNSNGDAEDFGHGDLWTGKKAYIEAWSELKVWLLNHNAPVW